MMMNWWGRSPVVYRQHNEEDCGAACLAAIARHYGYAIDFQRIRLAVGTTAYGTTLLGLQQGADQLGFHARPVQAAPAILDQISALPVPAILHWQGNHWVVLYGQRRDRFVIADPALGLRDLTRAELAAGWQDWVALLLEPDLHRLAEEPIERRSSARYFLQSFGFFRGLLTQVLLLSAGLGLLSLATPLLIQVLTDDVLVRQDLELLNTVAIAILALLGLSTLLGWIQSHLVLYFAKRVELGLVLQFARNLLHLPLAYFETHRSGEIASRLQDIQVMNQLIAQTIVQLPGQLLVAAVSLLVMSIYSPVLTGIALLAAGAIAFAPLVNFRRLQQKVRRTLALDSENQGVLVELFKGALTLKTLQAEPHLWNELQGRFGRLARLDFQTAQIGLVNTTLSNFAAGTGTLLLLWFGSRLVIQGNLSIGQLLAMHSLNRNIVALLAMLVAFVDEWTHIRAATQRLSDVVDAPREVSPVAVQPPINLEHGVLITCEHLTFAYPGQMELLRQLSVQIPIGVTALVGESGCGKSTLVKLIAGFYPVQSGNIRIGRYNLQDLSLENLRRQVVLVPQEPQFWSRSLLENFQLGNPQATLEDVIDVCQQVDADRFISQLPQTYHTVLGEFGANLSGGQRQRLAIARALLTDPPILILDESTSGLDHDSEVRLLDRVLHQRQGKTTLLISHRPSIVERADWLIVLKAGQVWQQGSVQELQAAQDLPSLPDIAPASL